MTLARDSSVSVRVLQRLIDAIELAGVPSAEIMRALDNASLKGAAAEARISRIEVERICELAIDLSGDPAFGLHWARGLSERSFAPISHLLAHAGSLRQGLQLLSAYEKLFCDEPFYSLSETTEHATLNVLTGWTFGSPRAFRFAAEMVVAGFLLPIRAFRPDADIAYVSFEYAAPPYHAEYTTVMGACVRFEQPFTGVVFDRTILDVPSPRSDDDVHAAMQTVAERRLLRVAQHAPYALRVRELLNQRAPARSTMASVARALGLSVRSLRSQLSTEATSYRAIEYAALASFADQLLRDKRLSIQETAYAMGFSDAATFHRAFKQWTGMTPAECRQRA